MWWGLEEAMVEAPPTKEDLMTLYLDVHRFSDVEGH